MIGLDLFQRIDCKILFSAVLAFEARDIVDNQHVVTQLVNVARVLGDQVHVPAEAALLAHGY
jgi:hypothetical protein